MASGMNQPGAQGSAPQFTSVSAGADGSAWGIDAAGVLYTSTFTIDPNTSQRIYSWQAVASDKSWKQVCAAAPQPLWCLDNTGYVSG
jgi:hypothetical protein